MNQRGILLLASLLAACAPRGDHQLLTAAGIEAPITCVDAEGLERTSFCGATFSTFEAESAMSYLGLEPLEQPEKHGRVTNVLNLPFECRLLLFDNPHPKQLYGVFDSPYALHERRTGIQFARIVMARSQMRGQTCFTLVRE